MKPRPHTTHYQVFILLIILLLAFLLRTPHITDKEKGPDEKLTLNYTTIYKEYNGPYTINAVYTISPLEVNPPLYFILLGYVARINDSILTLRLFNILISILGILLLYLLAKRLFSPDIALLAAALLALHPMHIIYTQHLRSYILFMLLSILALYFLYIFLQKRTTTSLVLTCITYVIAVYVHYYAIFLVLGGALTVFLSYFKDKKTRIGTFCTALIPTLLTLIPAFLLLQMQRVRLYISDDLTTFSFLEIPYPLYKLSVMMNAKSVLDRFPYLGILFPLLVFLAGYGFLHMYKHHTKKAILLGSHLAAPFIVLSIAAFFFPVFAYRYFVYLLPLYTLLLSYGLVTIQSKKIRFILLLIIILGWAWVTAFYYQTATLYHWAINLGI